MSSRNVAIHWDMCHFAQVHRKVKMNFAKFIFFAYGFSKGQPGWNGFRVHSLLSDDKMKQNALFILCWLKTFFISKSGITCGELQKRYYD